MRVQEAAPIPIIWPLPAHQGTYTRDLFCFNFVIMLWSPLFLASLAAVGNAQEDVSAAALASAERTGGSILQKLYSLKLQASIKESALKKKAKELENAAYSTPERNRVFGSPG